MTFNPIPPPRLGSQIWCPKQDDRPEWGWYAPGDYVNQCHRCWDYFIGDKRAFYCADCAYSSKEGL